MFNPSPLAAVLAAAGMAVSAQANEVYELDRVVVTAARTAQTVDQALAPVTVITRDEIERSQATSVTELLNRTPGMQIASNGGAGSIANVYLRGTRSAQTLVLIDGHKINSVDSNIAPLQYLDPDQIERIEVVRGPKSSLYGADAMGGVIQIFTRKGKGKPGLQLKAGIGNRGTGEYGVNYSGEVAGTRFSFGAKLYETQGYDHTESQAGTDAGANAYRNKSVTGSVSRVFENDVETGFMFSHSRGKAEYDHNFGSRETYPYNDFKITRLSSYITLPVNEIWDSRLDAGYVSENTDRMEEGSAGTHQDSFTKSRLLSASWQNDVFWLENQLLTTGLDYAHDRIETDIVYAENSRYNLGIFAQNLWELERSELQAGIRYDKNESYGKNVTGNIAWGFDLPGNMRLTPSYGTAFRAPTFTDLYWPGSENPGLKAERSENFELELRGSHRGVNWSVNLYENQIKDMLTWHVPDPDNPYAGRMENIDEARIRGLELAADAQLMGWHLAGSLTFLDPENRTTGKTLEHRAQQLLTFDADRDIGKLTVGGTLRGQGRSYDDPANNTEVPGFLTVDLRTAYAITSELKAELKLVNLMDKQYTTTRGYRSEPLGGLFTMIWSPQLSR